MIGDMHALEERLLRREYEGREQLRTFTAEETCTNFLPP